MEARSHVDCTSPDDSASDALDRIDRQLLTLIADRLRLSRSPETSGQLLQNTTRDRMQAIARSAQSLGLRTGMVHQLWNILVDEALLAANSQSRLATSAIRIDHVTLAVRDLSEAISTYQNLYGFVLDRVTEQKGDYAGMHLAVMRAGSVQLVIVQGTSERSQVSRFIENHGPGVQHIAIQVADIDLVADDLTQRGLAFLSPVIRGPGLDQIFAVRDSATSLQVELVQRTGATDFDDGNILKLFRSMEEAGAY